MDWIAGNSLYKSSPYTRQQQQSTMHAVNIYNTQYRISYSKGNNSSIAVRNLIYSVIDKKLTLKIIFYRQFG
jgi:hypothetical protein